MRELDKVLDSNEKVLWEGAPSFWPFLIGNSAPLTIFGVLWMGMLSSFIIISFMTPGPMKFFFFAMPHFWIGLAMMFGPGIYNFLVFKHIYYAITDKRLIIQKGVIGRDFDMVDFDQITNAHVDVGLFDKVFGQDTGSIRVSTAGTVVETKNGSAQKPLSLSHIQNPYEVFKFFKKVTHDVKTDIEYPNKLRPGDNPGYQTEYKPN